MLNRLAVVAVKVALAAGGVANGGLPRSLARPHPSRSISATLSNHKKDIAPKRR
jgi:hypothetical protein